MARVYQVPRHAIGWMLLAAMLASLPHWVGGPFWLGGLVIGAIGWRWLSHQGRIAMPGRLVRTLMLGGLVAITWFHYGTLFGPTAGVSLLVGAFALKLLEMFRFRDAWVVIVLACFVLATVFLHHRGLGVTLYVLLAMTVVTAALIGLNQPESGGRARHHLKLATIMLGQALPMTIVLFVVMPRIPPLWSVDSSDSKAVTGIGNTMAPGEISQLTRSDEPVFRVTFEGERPPRGQLYWRGIVYTWFDGRSWHRHPPGQPLLRDGGVYYPDEPRQPRWLRRRRARRSGPAYDYEIIMEASGRTWLYALAAAFPHTGSVGVTRTGRLVSRQDVTEPFSYRVTSYTQMARDGKLPERVRQRNLQLPAGFNPRTRALAQRWRARVNSDRAFIQRVLRFFHNKNFYYTLTPPELGHDSVDEFLFRTRRGFCAHYASALTFMLRSVGIPARVVAGYLGGAVNPLGDHLVVRKRDAHAWTEAWLPERGWVRVDPTAAVAPARIRYGLERALEGQGGAGRDVAAFDGLDDIALLQELGYLADYLEYKWQRWVLGYDQADRLAFLRNWLDQVSPLRVAAMLAVFLTLVLLPIGLWVLLGKRAPGLDPLQREYWRMQRLLHRRGLAIRYSEPPRELADSVARHAPGAEQAIQSWSRLYEQRVYAGGHSHGPARKQLRRARRRVRRNLRRAR